MKIIMLIFTLCNISFILFSMEEQQQTFKIWNSGAIRIFFPDIGYQKNQNKKYDRYTGCLFKEKEHDYYTIETCVNDQKFKACLQLNDYQKECIEKNENTMTLLLKDEKGNIQIDIEKINDKECKKSEVANLLEYHIFSEDEELIIGAQGDVYPKRLDILTLYSNKIYFQENKSYINIYKQSYQNVIETFGEGNKIYELPLYLEETKKLETRTLPFYLYVNNKTDNTVKTLIRIALINDKISNRDQNKQEKKYRENNKSLSYEILSDRTDSEKKTDSEKINDMEAVLCDIYNFLITKNNQENIRENSQEIEHGYPSDSYSDQDIINNQKANTENIIENFTTFTEKIMQENQQLKTQLDEIKKGFVAITNQNNEILEKIHSAMVCVSFWAIVLLMYYTYKSNRALVFN